MAAKCTRTRCFFHVTVHSNYRARAVTWYGDSNAEGKWTVADIVQSLSEMLYINPDRFALFQGQHKCRADGVGPPADPDHPSMCLWARIDPEGDPIPPTARETWDLELRVKELERLVKSRE
jgi:hypothetical protein